MAAEKSKEHGDKETAKQPKRKRSIDGIDDGDEEEKINRNNDDEDDVDMDDGEDEDADEDDEDDEGSDDKESTTNDSGISPKGPPKKKAANTRAAKRKWTCDYYCANSGLYNFGAWFDATVESAGD